MSVTAGRWFPTLVATVAMAVLAGCGGDRSGGPTGSPGDVVGRAPDTTLSAGTARIMINGPTAAASGVVDLVKRSGRLTVRATGIPTPAMVTVVAGVGYIDQAPSRPALRLATAVPDVLSGGDPFADLDLIRGTVHILSDGGNEVEGVSTIAYTLTIDPKQALDTTPPERRDAVAALLAGRTLPFPIEVWIDASLRVRRVEVPTDLRPTTPSTRSDRMPIATDVDFVSFGVPVGTVTMPQAGGTMPQAGG
ncbi:MAG: hypothetical protein M3N98_05245 [Actinomycetota bacterium]|nr:hypothetical protein [Actinomycetota bacterium]